MPFSSLNGCISVVCLGLLRSSYHFLVLFMPVKAQQVGLPTLTLMAHLVPWAISYVRTCVIDFAA